MEKYMEAIRQNVCSICADSNDDGECMLTDNEICAIKNFLPEILDVVKKRDSDDFDQYYKDLKRTVCTNCKARSEEGKCYLREDANCSLERYFSIIVDTVKAIDTK